LTRVTRYLRIT